MANKKMTHKYWNSLDKGSKKSALISVFPLHQSIADMLINEKPNSKSPWWKIVFSKVRIPEDNSHYKTVVNNTYIP